MAKYTIHKTFLSVLITLAFTGALVGKSQFVNGMTPYASALVEFEGRVFKDLEDKRNAEFLRYEERMKLKILLVMSKYQTGLEDDDLKQLPGWILAQSKRYGYDPLFLTALIQTESSFNNWARSNQGALGLMQIRPTTGHALAAETMTEWLGKPTLYDPGINIALGAYYLNKMVLRFGDLRLALEAYNHGPSQLSIYLKNGKSPSRYSKKVFQNYRKIRMPII